MEEGPRSRPGDAQRETTTDTRIGLFPGPSAQRNRRAHEGTPAQRSAPLLSGAGGVEEISAMLNHSEYFEELCALAASGQISEPEFEELQDHMRDCARCRSA